MMEEPSKYVFETEKIVLLSKILQVRNSVKHGHWTMISKVS